MLSVDGEEGEGGGSSVGVTPQELLTAVGLTPVHSGGGAAAPTKSTAPDAANDLCKMLEALTTALTDGLGKIDDTLCKICQKLDLIADRHLSINDHVYTPASSSSTGVPLAPSAPPPPQQQRQPEQTRTASSRSALFAPPPPPPGARPSVGRSLTGDPTANRQRLVEEQARKAEADRERLAAERMRRQQLEEKTKSFMNTLMEDNMRSDRISLFDDEPRLGGEGPPSSCNPLFD